MKVKWLVFVITIMILLSILLFSACAEPTQEPTSPSTPTTPTAPEEVYTAIFTTDSAPQSEGWLNFYKPMFDEMEEACGGRLEIEEYLGASLYKDMETVNVLPQGMAQICQINQSFWKSKIPELSIIDMMGYFDSPDHWVRWYREFGKDFNNKLYKEQNTMILTSRWVSPTTPFYTKAKLSSLDEVKGANLKIQCFGPDFTALANAMEVSPITLGIMEVYEGLERGLIDGAYAGPGMVTQFKWYEQLESMWYGIVTCGNTHTVMNLKWFNSLPSDMQEKMIEIGTKWEDIGREQLLEADQNDVASWKEMNKITWEPTPQEVNEIREIVKEQTKAYLVGESLGQETFDLYLEAVEKTR